MFLLDSHCDTPSQILRLRDLAVDNEYATSTSPNFEKGESTGPFLRYILQPLCQRQSHMSMLHDFWRVQDVF